MNPSPSQIEFDKVIEQVEKQMFGMRKLLNFVLIAYCTERHVLLEGNPGLGKTALVKALGRVLYPDDREDKLYGRIQFTPDLMPTDITGTESPSHDGSGQWNFKHGPIFKSLLLADEINRATPKTQAAMLEAMGEKQVTVLGKTYCLPSGREKVNGKCKALELPFMVLATQNPIDQEGTYPLPEAQADRFMFKLLMALPQAATLKKIIHKETYPKAQEESGFQQGAELSPNGRSTLDVQTAFEKIAETDIDSRVEMHINHIFYASNKQFLQDKSDLVKNVANAERLRQLVKEIEFGIGSRGAVALSLAVKAWEYFAIERNENKRYDIEASTARSLAEIALPVLRHRIKLSYGWEKKLYEIKDWKSPNDPKAGEAQKNYEQLEEYRRKDIFLVEFLKATAPRGSEFAECIDMVVNPAEPLWV